MARQQKRSSRPQNYIKALIIVHGKSERSFVKHIQSNLHLNMKPHGKHKGKNSIQITSLMKEVLERYPFDTMNSFLKEYGEEVEHTGKGKNAQLIKFKLFIFLDTDDCTEEQKKAFKDKTMFRDHPLYDYIVPIYNDPKMEKVMLKCGLMKTEIKDSQKGEWYEKVFPVNKDKSVEDTKEDVETLNELFRKCNDTNMEEFITYCLDNIRLIG